jgi:hypothetical protein
MGRWFAREGGERITVMSLRLGLGRWRALALASVFALALTACETVTKHGHQFHDNDLQQITGGMSQDQVKTALGTPTTTAAGERRGASGPGE